MMTMTVTIMKLIMKVAVTKMMMVRMMKLMEQEVRINKVIARSKTLISHLRTKLQMLSLLVKMTNETPPVILKNHCIYALKMTTLKILRVCIFICFYKLISIKL